MFVLSETNVELRNELWERLESNQCTSLGVPPIGSSIIGFKSKYLIT